MLFESIAPISQIRSGCLPPALLFITQLFRHPSLFPHSSRKNTDDPSTSPSKSHRHARIHPANGSLQTALS
jgi:hypothetical protein